MFSYVCSHTEAYRHSRTFTHRGSHSVRFGVDEASDLCEVAVALGDKLDGGGLHEEGVVGGQDALDSLFHRLNHYRLPPAVHELPHLVVGGDFSFLQDTREKKWNEVVANSIQRYGHLLQSVTFNYAGYLLNIIAIKTSLVR